ncbi:hypothetical protein NC652_028128 [Populus alba x Populus x berolinensis]|nr:hypothetical protein NC652_028128 [Populus alba x Populus x berolinensis]
MVEFVSGSVVEGKRVEEKERVEQVEEKRRSLKSWDFDDITLVKDNMVTTTPLIFTSLNLLGDFLFLNIYCKHAIPISVELSLVTTAPLIFTRKTSNSSTNDLDLDSYSKNMERNLAAYFHF